jgi:hypothetical protein
MGIFCSRIKQIILKTDSGIYIKINACLCFAREKISLSLFFNLARKLTCNMKKVVRSYTTGHFSFQLISQNELVYLHK